MNDPFGCLHLAMATLKIIFQMSICHHSHILLKQMDVLLYFVDSLSLFLSSILFESLILKYLSFL